MQPDKKIAIFQNFLDNIGGAEVVGLTMARELNAVIYTTNIDREKIRQMGFDDVEIRSIGRVPINPPFRQQMVLRRFRKLNLGTTYDHYIINGDWAVSAAMNHKPNLWYVNATIREIWDLYSYTRKTDMPWWQRPIFDAWAAYNRRLNKKHVAHVGTIAANSTYTQERVLNYLKRNSNVIYPPTPTARFHSGKSTGYWLSVNRLIRHKRVDIQMKAFAMLPDEKLIILGPYERSGLSKEYAEYIAKICPPNVKLQPQADSFAELADYYANCKGFITTSYREDFGMTAVEAMASGKMVIAPNEGGYMETVVDGETGFLISDITPEKIAAAIQNVGKMSAVELEKFATKCRDRATLFDTSSFIAKIKEMIRKN